MTAALLKQQFLNTKPLNTISLIHITLVKVQKQ